jgi:DNA-binding IclR family transcriptional regulator
MMQDKARSDDLLMTQENLATLLGGGRPRVNRLLATLETNGILSRHRGRIHLLTRQGLERLSCECYRRICDAAAPLNGTSG